MVRRNFLAERKTAACCSLFLVIALHAGVLRAEYSKRISNETINAIEQQIATLNERQSLVTVGNDWFNMDHRNACSRTA
jgi:hypothetical protein